MKKLIFLFAMMFVVGMTAQTFTGSVTKVKDGDTVVVVDSLGVKHNVRVAGVDCPEKTQDYGQEAKTFTSVQVLSKLVKVKVQTVDIYKREVAWIYYNNNKNLSEELLRYGYGHHYIKYDKSPLLQKLEDNAKDKKLGLWQNPNAILPEDYRKEVKSVPKKKSA